MCSSDLSTITHTHKHADTQKGSRVYSDGVYGNGSKTRETVVMCDTRACQRGRAAWENTNSETTENVFDPLHRHS